MVVLGGRQIQVDLVEQRPGCQRVVDVSGLVPFLRIVDVLVLKFRASIAAMCGNILYWVQVEII